MLESFSRNPNHLYACHLTYHHLSTSYFAIESSLASMSIPKSINEALSDPEWQQTMMDWFLYILVVLGILFPYLLAKWLLVANGYMLLR